MVEIEVYDIRRYLPMPYEAALAPRLLRAQERAETAAGCLEVRPETLQAVGARLRAGSRALVSVGDGGLAARAVARRLGSSGDFRLFFPDPASAALQEVLAQTGGQPVSVFVSGPLKDPGAAALLRLLLEALAARDPGGPACQVVAAAVEGTPLMHLARSQGWEILPVPAQAGRFDALTAAALLPAAAAGADVEALLQGAAGMRARCRETSFANPAWRYAALRHELYRRGWAVEALSSRDPALSGVQEWWQALFAGCEGKDGKGLFPAIASATAGPLGLGQYLQEGRRLVFETALRLGGPLEAPSSWRSGRPNAPGKPCAPDSELDFLRDKAEEAALLAHSRAGVPCLRINADYTTAAAQEGAGVPEARAAECAGVLQAAGTARRAHAAFRMGAAFRAERVQPAQAVRPGGFRRGALDAALPSAENRRAAGALGELLCFFQYACGLSAGLLDVDPQSCGALDAYGETLSGLLQRLRGPGPKPDAKQL